MIRIKSIACSNNYMIKTIVSCNNYYRIKTVSYKYIDLFEEIQLTPEGIFEYAGNEFILNDIT